MPVPGGVSDKFGNRYEGRWTVVHLAKVLSEAAVGMRLEPWDSSVEGVEFVVNLPDADEYHQVKRQVSGAVQWTVDHLARVGVLASARAQLSNPTSRYVFLSSSPSELREVGERARTAESFDAFRSQLETSTRRAFTTLAKEWSPWTDEQVFDGLRRFDAATVDEPRVLELARSRVSALVTGSPDSVIDILAAYVLEHLTQHVDAGMLWAHLEARGHEGHDWWRNESVLGAIGAQRNRILAESERRLVSGRVIPRAIQSELEGLITAQDPPSVVVIVGAAGEGKTVLLAEAIKMAQARGMPVLPLRADRLVGTTPVSLTARGLGEALGLPTSPPGVLANIARGRRALLVIDQLDAVSLLSARNTSAFEIVDEMVREAMGHPNLTVLAACRRYDLDNDPGLRALRDEMHARVVEVGPLTVEQVITVLRSAGIALVGLSDRQMELLQNPLHLGLLLEAGSTSATWIRSRKGLLDRYWEEKRRRTSEKLGREARWTETIDRLTREIDSRQRFAVPFLVLDEWDSDATAMVSEGVLARDGALVAFAHQAFFDYAFARHFIRSGGYLPGFVRDGGQQLFQRAQVREILVHLRDVSDPRYLRVVAELLSSPDVRFHIKDAVLTMLESIDDPTREEWGLLRDGLTGWGDGVAARLRGILARRKGWFSLALDDDWFARGLADPDSRQVDATITILARAQRVSPSAVAEVLLPYVGKGGDWSHRLGYVIRTADLTLDQAFLAFSLAAIRAGDTDEVRPFAANGSFWDEAYQLARTRSAWAAEFVRAFLDRRMELGKPGNEMETFQAIPDPLDDDLFDSAASGAPEAWLANVLPWVLDLSTATSRGDGRRFDCFSGRWFGRGHGFGSGLISSIETALRTLADPERPVLDRWRVALAAAASETANFLLVRLGTLAPASQGPEVARLLVQEPARLQAGYMNGSHWAAREFIMAVAPTMPADLGASLQGRILDYYPSWELDASGRRTRGEVQWTLLSAFPDVSLTAPARARLLELRHKFGDEVRPPEKLEVERIGSPIPDEAAPKLSDDQWLAALNKYDTESIWWARPSSRAGGLHELAGTLFTQTVNDPRRFARLALRLPDSIPSRYMDEVLRGLSETKVDIPVEEVVSVCRRAHELPDHPAGRWIADAIAKHAHEDLPDEALELVSWYAVYALDPSTRHRPVTSDISEPELIEAHAWNSDRGRAVLAAGRLVRAVPARLTSLRAPVDAACQDPIDAVRVAAAEALIGWVRLEPAFAARGLRTLLSGMDDTVMTTGPVSRLVSYFLNTEFLSYQDLLLRMLRSTDAFSARVAGRIAALAALSSADALPTAEAALTGNDAHRLGVADVASANPDNEAVAPTCRQWLVRLFRDPAPEVRREAASWLASVSPEKLGKHADLVREFINSPAFGDDPTLLFHRLAASASVSPAIELEACESYVSMAGLDAGDISTRLAVSAADVSRIAVRAHDYGDGPIRDRALDVIDRLLEVGAFGITDAIDAFER